MVYQYTVPYIESEYKILGNKFNMLGYILYIVYRLVANL